MDTLLKLSINLFLAGLSIASFTALLLLYRSYRGKKILFILIIYTLFSFDFLLSLVTYFLFIETEYFPLFEKIRQYLILSIQLVEVVLLPFVLSPREGKKVVNLKIKTYWCFATLLILLSIVYKAVNPGLLTLDSFFISIPTRVVDYSMSIYILYSLIKYRGSFITKNTRIILFSVMALLFPYLLAEDIFSVLNRELKFFYGGTLAYLFMNSSIIVISIKKLIQKRAIKNDKLSISVFCELYKITPGEERVLKELLKGKKYRDISETLFISYDTVKSHASKIYKKSRVNGRIELKYRVSPENHPK